MHSGLVNIHYMNGYLTLKVASNSVKNYLTYAVPKWLDISNKNQFDPQRSLENKIGPIFAIKLPFPRQSFESLQIGAFRPIQNTFVAVIFSMVTSLCSNSKRTSTPFICLSHVSLTRQHDPVRPTKNTFLSKMKSSFQSKFSTDFFQVARQV